MRKLLLILFIISSLYTKAQLREYYIEAYDLLEAKRAFVLGGDSVYNTTQISLDDTTLVTLKYLKFINNHDTPGSYAGYDSAFVTVSGDSLIFTPRDSIKLTEFDSTGFKLSFEQIIGSNYYYEKELTDNENYVDIGFILNPSALVFLNGDAVLRNQWFGIGSTVIFMPFPIKEYDNIIVSQSYDVINKFEKELLAAETDINIGFNLTASSLVLINGDAVMSTRWSGVGTQSIHLNFPIKQFDNIIIKN